MVLLGCRVEHMAYQHHQHHHMPATQYHHPSQVYWQPPPVPPAAYVVNHYNSQWPVGYPWNPGWTEGPHQLQPSASETSRMSPLEQVPVDPQPAPPPAAPTSAICIKDEPDTDKAGPAPAPSKRAAGPQGLNLTFPMQGRQDPSASTDLALVPASGPSPALGGQKPSGPKRRIVRVDAPPLPQVEEEKRPHAPSHRDVKKEELAVVVPPPADELTATE